MNNLNANNTAVRPGVKGALKEYFATQMIPIVVLVGIIIVAGVVSPVFFSAANFTNLFVQVALNMVVSMGLFCVILTGGIDLSVGSLVAVAGVFVAGFMQTISVGLAIVAATGLTTLFGAVTGFIVAKVKIAPFIVTLGMMSFMRGCAYWYTGATPISWTATDGADFMFMLGSEKLFNFIPMPAVVWIIVVFCFFLMLKYTVLGRIIYSIGGNEEAVRLSGLDVTKWKMAPYIISGLCCGIGGLLLTARLGVGAPQSGDALEMDCISATVIGGTSMAGGIGTVSGVVIGVFILGIINNILDLMNVPAYPQMMLKGVIIVVAVIISTRRNKG